MVLLADYGPAWEAWLVVRVWLLPDPVARLIHARRDARVHQMVLRVMHEGAKLPRRRRAAPGAGNFAKLHN